MASTSSSYELRPLFQFGQNGVIEELHDSADAEALISDQTLGVSSSEQERVQSQTKAIFQRIAYENAVAGVLFLFCTMPTLQELEASIYSQTPKNPCGYYERIYFSSLSPEDQLKIRRRFFALFKACVEHHFDQGYLKAIPRVTLGSCCVEEMMFANRGAFRRVMAHELGEIAHFDDYMQLVVNDLDFGRQVNLDLRVSALLVSPALKEEERGILKVLAGIETAIHEDTYILGLSWTGARTFRDEFRSLFSYLPRFAEACSWEVRRQFFHYTFRQQDRIRVALLNQRFFNGRRDQWRFRRVHFVLADLGISSSSILAERSGGKYRSYADLISDDLLFRNEGAYQRARDSVLKSSSLQQIDC